jgi:hypothetical protein
MAPGPGGEMRAAWLARVVGVGWHPVRAFEGAGESPGDYRETRWSASVTYAARSRL